MLELIKLLKYKEKLLLGNFGIERETLRVDEKGKLALTKHPVAFGDKIRNPYITTDFSESQIELITPPINGIERVYKALNSLYDITAMELKDEYLWPQSMPCNIPNDEEIPIAEYNSEEIGENASNYRKHLLKKYGGKKQLISGIHYNFSFNEDLIKELYKLIGNNKSYREFRDELYLKTVRNYLRYRWILIYLLGGTSIIHESFKNTIDGELDRLSEDGYSNIGTVSYRNSEHGYKNQITLYPNYNTVNDYVESINSFVKDNVIKSHKELYAQIRVKAYDNDNFLDSLKKDGINYLEIRSIDINPFEKCGISKEDLEFINIFTLYCLITKESDFKNWQEEAEENQNNIALYGLNEDTIIYRNGKARRRNKIAIEILDEIREMSAALNLNKEDIIDNMIAKFEDSTLTYSYKITKLVEKEGYINAHMNLAKAYKKEAFDKRFILEGYEDLELSTQILLKEAIKRGVKFEILDRKDNFIALKNKDKIEYIKQATKTSKDTYSAFLIMENKVVTKKVLEKNNIKVPKGYEFTSLEESIRNINSYSNKPIVIKPKSTNFGLGISIFKEKGNLDNILDALKIAFTYDDTVLVEEFIKGYEYRFLVIGDKVSGILNRVPANVVGDGRRSIKELVEIKNKDSLRGKGYKTPLEKIELDEHVKLFLKEGGKNFNYTPNKGEVVFLRENSNISTGGDSIDFTDLIPEKFKKIAVESAKAVGANICGVDMMIEDYKDENSNYSIIELNFNPAIHIHSYPYKGKERNIAKDVLGLLELI